MALGTGPVNNLTALSLVSPKLHTGEKKVTYRRFSTVL